ncbi:MAG: hypothetical protein EAZ91_16070 [Cytophagales bacterium]|nr:MAG: hypothetical protein EAZ91_16070 [Cytophagales bacterium]
MNLKNLFAYLQERFPPVNMALFAVLFGTVYSVARYFWSSYTPAPFGLREVGGMVAVITFFFRLRVFDEIKDYDLDAINHPQRVLQSGRVNLRQLFTLAVAGGVWELAWSVWSGWPTVVCWVLAVGYSLLMRYEFFVGAFLKKRLLLYAITHMLIMPLVIAWVWSAYTPDFGLSRPLYLLAALSLLGGFAFEIARKLHTPAAERPLVDSYSKTMGYAGAIGAVLLVLTGSVLVQRLLLTDLRSPNLPFVLIGLLYAATLVLYGLALARPAEKTLKLGELLVSLSMLVSYVCVIGVVL